MNAKEANNRLGVGFQAASDLEPRLIRQYEAALRALAKRVVGRYKQLAVIAPVLAAGPPEKPEPPQPTLSEVLDAELAAESAAARTRATRRRMAKEVADALTVGFQVESQLRGLLQALVDQQAGAQAERLVEGSRDAVAEVMLDSLVNGATVDETAAALLEKLELDAVWRAKMLARTDLIAISNGAAQASAQVLGEDGPQFKTWLSARDDRVRPDHVEANGQVQPIGQPFQVGDSLLQYPGDPAGADDTVINCRCLAPDVRVSGATALAGTRRAFEGHLLRITTAGGRELSVTSEHPILTRSGWKAAESVNVGDDLVCAIELIVGFPDVQDVPPSVEEFYAAAYLAGARRERVMSAAVNFHGHRPDTYVDVAVPNGNLALHGEPTLAEECRDLVLSLAHREMSLDRNGSALSGVTEPNVPGLGLRAGGASVLGKDAVNAAALDAKLAGEGVGARSGVELMEQARGDGSVRFQHVEMPGLSLRSAGVPSFADAGEDETLIEADLVRDLLVRHPGLVQLDPVVDVVLLPFRGHVYNLSTLEGCYLANGIVTANCVSIFSDGPAPILRHSNDGGNLETVLVTAAASARNVERNLSTNPGSEEDDVKNVSVTVTPDFDLAYVEGGELRIPMTASTGELAQIDAPQSADNKRYSAAFCEECGGDVDEDGNCPNCGEHDTKMAAAALTADASPLAATLVPVVAAATSMYLSAAGAHWNVTGTDFTEYHALFGEIYEDVQGSIDPLAENILKLGGRAPQNIQEMTAASPVPTVFDVREPGGFARQLADVNDGVISALTAAFAVANSLNEQGVANFLAERIDAHQKWRWQLRASLGEDASGDERLVAGGFRAEEEQSEAALLYPPDHAFWKIPQALRDLQPELAAREADALTAAAAGLAPLAAPAEWFEVPEADGATALQITEDGRVFGHAATWGTCHTGIQGRCQTPPRSPSGYSYFHLGEVDTADGKRVPVGKVTLDTGHAPMAASSKATAAHYDHTGAVAAYVRARDGQHGIWVSGVLDPDLPVSKVRALKAAALSGDWRSVRGQLELIGLLAVNVPGFPIPRAQAQLVASGAEDEVEALVAAGIVCDCEPDAEAELSGLIGDTVGARELDRLIAACVPGRRRMLYGRAAKR